MIKNNSKRKLMKHQKEALRILHKLHGRCGLFMAPGTGKTLTAIRFIRPERRKSYFPALIICRRDDYLTWKQELLMEGVSLDDILMIDHKSEWKTRKDKKGEYWDYHQQELPDEPQLWNIVSYDLIRDKQQNFSEAGWWIYKNHFEVVVADECQMIKRWKANRSKVVINLVKNINRRIPMTGTPITQSVEDSFMHGLFIDDGKTFGTNHFYFKKRYYNQCKNTKQFFIKKDSNKIIRDKLGEISFHVHEDDVMKDLPKALPPIIKSCAMYGKQRRLYEDVLEHWEINEGKKGFYELDYTIDVTQKLKQIASGFYYNMKGNAVRVKNRKIEMLADLANDPDYLKGENSIIWVSHVEELEIVSELAHKLRIGYIPYTGSSRKKREALRIQYRDDKSKKWFICNVERGKGMNELIKARNRVYFSNSTKVEAKEQSMRRNRRKGSEMLHDFIRTIELVTEGTVDLNIIQCLNDNIDIAQYVLQKAKLGLRLREIFHQQSNHYNTV